MNRGNAGSVRAMAYLALAAAFVVGAPWALLHFIGSPLPANLPDAQRLRDWIDQPFAGPRAWKAAAIVFWALWALIVYLLAAELLRSTGRLRPARLRLRPIEAIAAGMVGATTAVIASSAAYAATPTTVTTLPADPYGLDDPHGPGDGRPRPAGALLGAGTPSYVVQRGDWLSAIAARFLANPDAYPQLVALNPQLATRGAHHIEAGWRLTLPADASDHGIRLHATGAFAPAPPAPEPAPPPPAADQPEPEPPTVRTLPPDQNPDGDGAPDYVVENSNGAMAGAGLLAALMLALLTAERRRQRTWLAAGEEPPLPRSGRAERELRAAQQPIDVERLAAALADLGERLAGQATPDIVGVRLVGGDVNLLLGEPDDHPPEPWLDEGTQWALPAYIEPSAIDHPPTLLPLLAGVGSRAGRHLLIDLHRLGVVSITGDPARGRDLLRHIVCEIACATWSTDTTVLLAGFGDEATLLADIAPDRVHSAVSVEHALRADRHVDPGHVGVGPVLLAVAQLDPAGQAALSALHRQPGITGIAVVAVAGESAAIGPATLAVTADGALTVDIPGLRLATDAASVPVEMLEPMAQVFRVARLTQPTQPTADTAPDPSDSVLAIFDPAALQPDPQDQPGVLAQDDPDPTLDADLAAWQLADPTRPRLGILGSILVQLPGALTDSRQRLLTELLLYLLTRSDRAAHRDQIEDALWYGNPAPSGSLRTAMVRLRRWLGPRPDGTEWIPEGYPDAVYRLTDGVLLDWHLITRLRARAHRRAEHGHADRRAALSLVRGTPMRDRIETGRYRRPYTWIGDSDINPGRIIATVTDLAHQLATDSLDLGDTATTRWAVRQAWLIDPDRTYDDLWLDHLAAEHYDGHTAAANQLLTELCEQRDAEILEDLPPKLYNRIREILPDQAQ